MEKVPVAHIFMDESGDLGFSEKSRQTYVIGYVIMTTATPHYIRHKSCRLLQNINKRLSEKCKISEFKFSNDSSETRVKFLELIRSLNLDLGAIVVRKDSVKSDLKERPNILYNYLAVKYVVPIAFKKYLKPLMPINRIKFKIDRSLSKADRELFNQYYDNTVSSLRWKEGFRDDVMAEIEHENSMNDVCLQIADYVAGSVNRKMERGDPTFYDIIQKQIKYRDQWDWNKNVSW